MLFINVKEIKKPLNIQTLLAFLQGTVKILFFFFFFGLTIISNINKPWCNARNLFGLQIPVIIGGFHLQNFCIQSSYQAH